MTLEQIADMKCGCDYKKNELCPACEAAHVLNEIDEIRRDALYNISIRIKRIKRINNNASKNVNND